MNPLSLRDAPNRAKDAGKIGMGRSRGMKEDGGVRIGDAGARNVVKDQGKRSDSSKKVMDKERREIENAAQFAKPDLPDEEMARLAAIRAQMSNMLAALS
jgi:hypothetical protein